MADHVHARGQEGNRKELLTSLGAGLTVDVDGVMGGAKNAKFGGKNRFGKLTVGDKMGEEAEEKGKNGGGG